MKSEFFSQVTVNITFFYAIFYQKINNKISNFNRNLHCCNGQTIFLKRFYQKSCIAPPHFLLFLFLVNSFLQFTPRFRFAIFVNNVMNEYRFYLTGKDASTWRRLVGRYYWLPDSQIISHLVEVHGLSCKDHCSLDR